MTTRRGVSLVELTIVMSACTVVLTLSAVLMHRAMRTYTQAAACRDAERTAIRLSDQFRRDVHQARTVSIEEGMLKAGVFLRLDLVDGQIVEYGRQDGEIVRTLSNGGAVTSRDEYAFSPDCHVNVAEAAAPRRIALTITTNPADPPASHHNHALVLEGVPVSLNAEAVLGRDELFGTALASQERPE